MAQSGIVRNKIMVLKGKLEDIVDELSALGVVIRWEEMHSLEEEMKHEYYCRRQADYTYSEICDLLGDK